MARFKSLWALAVAGIVVAGCHPATPTATPVTELPKKQAYQEYWFNQPAVVKVESNNYDALWNACERAAAKSLFLVERFDYRLGVLSTKPLVSKQFFEFWKGDVVDAKSQILSDLATRRRTVRFQIFEEGDHFVCEPKVVVDHYSMPERRLTAVTQYQYAFSIHQPFAEENADDGTPERVDYWYAESRDPALERVIADRIREELAHPTKAIIIESR